VVEKTKRDYRNDHLYKSPTPAQRHFDALKCILDRKEPDYAYFSPCGKREMENNLMIIRDYVRGVLRCVPICRKPFRRPRSATGPAKVSLSPQRLLP
jgi:hypothetical protein